MARGEKKIFYAVLLIEVRNRMTCRLGLYMSLTKASTNIGQEHIGPPAIGQNP